MTLEGQPWDELLKVFAIFGGIMVLLYVLRLKRRRVQVPFSPLWSRVVAEKQATSLFRALKRIGSLLVQLAIVALVVLALGDPKVASFAGCTHEDEKPPPPRHALLVIDASASMATVEDGRSRLERAREEAHALVGKLAIHPSQRVMVVALDAQTREILHGEVERIWLETGKTVIFVTHNVREAVRLADRIVLMGTRPGRLLRDVAVALPRPRELNDEFVTSYAGEISELIRSEVEKIAREEADEAWMAPSTSVPVRPEHDMGGGI